jgi:hypothetical protein
VVEDTSRERWGGKSFQSVTLVSANHDEISLSFIRKSDKIHVACLIAVPHVNSHRHIAKHLPETIPNIALQIERLV